jgi:hypothetical protein
LVRVKTGNSNIIYAFGDNSSGQIEASKGNTQNLVVRRPKKISYANQFSLDKMGIHAGDKISAISINEKGKIETRKFYAWGGKNMIDTISMSAQV